MCLQDNDCGNGSCQNVQTSPASFTKICVCDAGWRFGLEFDWRVKEINGGYCDENVAAYNGLWLCALVCSVALLMILGQALSHKYRHTRSKRKVLVRGFLGMIVTVAFVAMAMLKMNDVEGRALIGQNFLITILYANSGAMVYSASLLFLSKFINFLRATHGSKLSEDPVTTARLAKFCKYNGAFMCVTTLLLNIWLLNVGFPDPNTAFFGRVAFLGAAVCDLAIILSYQLVLRPVIMALTAAQMVMRDVSIQIDQSKKKQMQQVTRSKDQVIFMTRSYSTMFAITFVMDMLTFSSPAFFRLQRYFTPIRIIFAAFGLILVQIQYFHKVRHRPKRTNNSEYGSTIGGRRNTRVTPLPPSFASFRQRNHSVLTTNQNPSPSITLTSCKESATESCSNHF